MRPPVRKPRRFIAGAVCPQCRAVDRVVLNVRLEVRWRECVSCGFSEPAAEGTHLGGIPRGKPENYRTGETSSDVVKVIMPEIQPLKDS